MKTKLIKQILLLICLSSVFMLFSIVGEIKTSPNFEFSSIQQSYLDYTKQYYPIKELWENGMTPNKQQHIYVIEDAVDLNKFSELCSGPQKEVYLSLHYVLGNDINYEDPLIGQQYFRPIGFSTDPNPLHTPANSDYAFQGTFDGRGFSIHLFRLEVYKTSIEYNNITANELIHYSMFSVIGSAGVVKNFTLVEPNYIQTLDFGALETTSYIAGANYGLVDFVSVIDLREANKTGILAPGFTYAGLVVENYGVFSNSFIASPKVRHNDVPSSQSGPVSYVIHANKPGGVINRVFFDCTISNLCTNTPVQDENFKLPTSSFNSLTNFQAANIDIKSNGHGWILGGTYPSLKGFVVDPSLPNAYFIRNATDIFLLTKMIDQSALIRSGRFTLVNDIDMDSISSKALTTPLSVFSGLITSITVSNALVNNADLLYLNRPSNSYLSILNLQIGYGRDLGVYAGFGLFGVVSGTISNINLFGVKVSLRNNNEFTTEVYLSSGVVASRLQGGIISNVHVAYTGYVSQSLITRLYHGGLVGSGNGSIINSSVQGNFHGGVHAYSSKLKDSSIGGLIGYGGIPEATNLSIRVTGSINESRLIGMGYASLPTSTESLGYLNVGGIVGSGLFDAFLNVKNNGNLKSHEESSVIAGVSMGGIIGFGTQVTTTSVAAEFIENNGSIELIVNKATIARIGIGFGVLGRLVDIIPTSRTYRNIENTGQLITTKPSNVTLTSSELQKMDIIGAGIVLSHGYPLVLDTIVNRLYPPEHPDEEKPFMINVSYVKQFAGINLNNSNFTSGIWTDSRDYFNNDFGTSLHDNVVGLIRITNYKPIIAYTTDVVYHRQIKLSGIALGKLQTYFLIRNEADVLLEFSHNADSNLASDIAAENNFDMISNNRKNIIITGVGEQVNTGRRAESLYNRGTISVSTKSSVSNIDVKYHVYISGLFQRIRNVQASMTHSSAVKLLLNEGYIVTSGKITGNIYASGIVSINSGTIQSSINTGDLYIQNQIQSDQYYIDASGIAAASILNTTSGRIWNSLNYGDVYAKSDSGFGYVNAAGIVARNNRSEIYLPVESNNRQYYNSISNSINYGTITANNTNTVANSSLAGGILGEGWMRIDNSINYGQINSSQIAGGIVSHFDMFSFAKFASQTNITTGIMANLINYGAIKKIHTDYSVTFSIQHGISYNDSTITPVRGLDLNCSYGGIIGLVTAGSPNWVIDTGQYSWNPSNYRDWLNMDSAIDFFGNTPIVQSNASNPGLLKAKFYTTKPADNSLEPFSKIDYYPLVDTQGGVFDKDFPFMVGTTGTPSSANFIRFIPASRVNDRLMKKIWPDFNLELHGDRGLYALGPTTGIGEGGLYFPDFFQLSSWNNTWTTGVNASDWQEIPYTGGETIAAKFALWMKQLSKSYATNIDRIQVYCVESPNIRLTNPIIDLIGNTITFYVADNSIAAQDPNRGSPSSVSVYVEASTPGSGNYRFDSELGQFVETLPNEGTHLLTSVSMYTFSGSTKPRTFAIDTVNPLNFTLGYKASFSAVIDEVTYSSSKVASIPNSYGDYSVSNVLKGLNGEVLDSNIKPIDSSGNPIESVVSYAGYIRVYSEAFEVGNTLTYRDYIVRLIRMSPLKFTGVNSLSVNGTNIDVPDDTFPTVNVQSNVIPFKPVAPQGQIAIEFNAKNLGVGSPHPDISVLLHTIAGANLSLSNRLSVPTPTNTQTLSGLHPSSGTWNDATYRFVFQVNPLLPAGEYKIIIRIGNSTDYEYVILFTKEASSEAFILTLVSANSNYYSTPTKLLSDDYEVTIPYGMTYNPSDPVHTKIMNFTNFANYNSLVGVPAASLSNNLPSNLTAMTIANLSRLTGVRVEVLGKANPTDLLEPFVYEVHYTITAENGLIVTKKLTIRERLPSPQIIQSYLGVNLINNPNPVPNQEDSYIIFGRDQNPIYHFVFDVMNFYTPLGVGSYTIIVTTTSSDEPPVEGIDYRTTMTGSGFTIEFLDSAPPGYYDITYKYVKAVTFSSGGVNPQVVEQNWGLTFQQFVIQKEGNHVHQLTNIFFTVESALLATLSTIIYPSEMNVLLYENLLNGQETSPILVSPRGDIQYGGQMGPYYVIGQVADTNLLDYSPTFERPLGAKVKRVLLDSSESDNLNDNFEPTDLNTFRYIKYIVYAENYIEGDSKYGQNYSEYYVAVLDTTNNIYLTIEVYSNATSYIPRVFTSFVLTNSKDSLTNISINSFITSFQEGVAKGSNYDIRPTQSGRFAVFVNVPIGVTYTITFNGQEQEKMYFIVPPTVISRRYTVKIYLIDQQPDPDDWGQRKSTTWVRGES
jgi:hypothetical protein